MGFFSSNTSNAYPWKKMDQLSDIDAVIEASFTKPQLVFKHSTRCSISSWVLKDFEKSWNWDTMPAEAHFLDLIAFRSVSNHIAEVADVEHQSPQVLVFHQGKCIYNASHQSIDALKISQILQH